MLGFVFGILSFFGCEASKSAVKGSSSVKQEAVEQPQTVSMIVELPPDKVEFYKTDFPSAAQFRKHDIPADFLSDIDKGNSVYYDVLNADGQLIGYLRDFIGPVTDEENCPCNPLSLTLTYNTEFGLRNVLSVAPLQKYGHEPLTEEEHLQMVSIAKSPSVELMDLQAPQDMIDGTSGATHLIYKDKVVDKAGYSSWRIAHLAADTARIIQGAPIQRDADRLQQMLEKARQPSEQMAIISEFIPTAESDYLKQRALYILAELYMQGLLTGEPVDSKVESIFLSSGLGDFQEAELLTGLCMAFVEQKVGLSFVSSCVETLERNEHRVHFESSILTIKGLSLLEQNKIDEGISYLEQGLSSGSPAPEFRQKLATLYKERSRPDDSCRQLEGIYIDAPLWPNIDQLLEECGEPEQLKERLDQTRKDAILANKVAEPKKVSVLELLDESETRQKIDLSSDDKLSVVVFFATWCPHCQREMPRLVEFYNQLQTSDLKDKVELVPIRAAIARENQSFASFKRQYGIPFPIMTDEGLSFELFANEQGIQAGFPLLAVTNSAGEVVYFPSHGDYNDTAKELFWILRSLQAQQ